jgi:hypothetical protein
VLIFFLCKFDDEYFQKFVSTVQLYYIRTII